MAYEACKACLVKLWISYYEFGKFSITIRILQVLTDLDNSISYYGLLELDWNYPWRIRHESRGGQVFMSLNHGQTVVIERRPSFSTLHY